LTSPEVISEEPLSEYGEEHETAGQHRLHERERGECERFDVQAPTRTAQGSSQWRTTAGETDLSRSAADDVPESAEPALHREP
jgi:hypothetical protein